MFFSAIVLVVSTALGLFYLQAICQKTLRREFAQPYFQAIVNAHRLQFDAVLKGLAAAGEAQQSASVYTRLKVDFVVLNCLMKQTSGTAPRFSFGQRLLRASFHVGLAALAVRQAFGLESARTAQSLATVLRYFSNVVGERLSQNPLANLSPSEYIAGL